MLSRVSPKQIQRIIFFLMMWVFYSLNSRYLKVPMATTFRWLLLGMLVISVIIANRAKIYKPPRMIFIFMLSVLPSVLASIDKVESVIKILSFMIVVWGSYIYFASLKQIEDLASVMRIVMVIIILFEVQSIICIFLGIGYMGDRATGVTTNSNTLGIYSNLALLASFYWSEQLVGIKKIPFWLLMIFSTGIAIASGSRTAFITLLLNVFAVLFLKMRGILRWVLMIAVGIITYLLFNGYFSFLNIRALNNLLTEDGWTRGALWDKGVEVWKRFPVFGCGYANSQLYNDLPGLERYAFHNSYLTYLAETGVWGMGIMGMALLAELKKILLNFITAIKSGKISLCQVCGMMLIELVIAAWGESFLFAVGSTEACTFWVIFSWLLVYRKRYGNWMVKKQ